MASTVLVITSLEDVTADWVIAALNERGVPVARVDPADIGVGLSFAARIGEGERPVWSGTVRTPIRTVELDEVAAVYYRRPTPYQGRFAHLPPQQRDFSVAEARHGLGGLLYALRGVRYVSHPAAIARADFKPAQLRRFAELGLTIPPTLITNDVAQAVKFAAHHGRIIYKTFRGLPPSENGYTGAIWAQPVDPSTFDDSIAVTAHLFQAEVPSVRNVRVTVVGDLVFAQTITAPRPYWTGAAVHPRPLRTPRPRCRAPSPPRSAPT
ncbi:MvdC/MvdD family ATP grasp protein [Streptomyces sp. NPDC017529]|uniref:MvdC/MvdD family ATP grasp protein n=1 Tax=Streptomyces sp. NPDC017529 TaxID=3365000 RepID=UPI003790D353